MLRLNRPHFLVAGPAKTGTTWLYEQLKTMDGFAMPPTKEINFFNELNFQRIINPANADVLKEFEVSGYEISPKAIAEAQLRFTNRRDMNRHYAIEQKRALWGWYYRYFPRNMGWISAWLYSLLFKHEDGVVTGDISPLYFVIGEQVIEKIASRFPEMKVIFIIREPVERAWSNIRMNYYSTQAKEGFNLGTYLAKQNLGSDYVRAIANWEKHFKPERIAYLFYDDLVNNPAIFLQKFLDFVKPGCIVNNQLKGSIGKGIEKQMDADIKTALYKINLPQYQFLAQKFGPSSYPAKWLKEAISINAGG